mmetsp:Transcript_13883/g.20319  ORF Transcript_13883/g.20319 Transcript_13883/m.20319 type:complete len:466 (+) Transcript_13883:5-1402(+)
MNNREFGVISHVGSEKVKVKVEFDLERGSIINIPENPNLGDKLSLDFPIQYVEAEWIEDTLSESGISSQKISINSFPRIIPEVKQALKTQFSSFRLCSKEDSLFKAIGAKVTELFPLITCPENFKQNLYTQLLSAQQLFPKASSYIQQYTNQLRQPTMSIQEFYNNSANVGFMTYAMRILCCLGIYSHFSNPEYAKDFQQRTLDQSIAGTSSLGTEACEYHIKLLAVTLDVCIKVLNLDRKVTLATFNPQKSPCLHLAYKEGTYYPLLTKEQVNLEDSNSSITKATLEVMNSNKTQTKRPLNIKVPIKEENNEFRDFLVSFILKIRPQIDAQDRSQLRAHLANHPNSDLESYLKRIELENSCTHDQSLKIRFPCNRKHCKTCVLKEFGGLKCFCEIALTEEQHKSFYQMEEVRCDGHGTDPVPENLITITGCQHNLCTNCYDYSRNELACNCIVCFADQYRQTNS